MTDTQSMTTNELVRRTLLDEHGDFLREAVAMVAAQGTRLVRFGDRAASRPDHELNYG